MEVQPLPGLAALQTKQVVPQVKHLIRKQMKTLLTILSYVLFSSVFFTPTDDAPLSTYFLWIIWVIGALYIVKLIWKELDKLENEDSGK